MSRLKRVLVTAALSKSALGELKKHFDVDYRSWVETRRVLSEDELRRALDEGGFDALVMELERASGEVLEAPSLKVVCVCRNDPSRSVDLERAAEKPVLVTYTPGRNANAVAELTVALMLALLRKVVYADRRLRSGVTVSDFEDFARFRKELEGSELSGKTVGIIGLGKIGGRVAELLSGFNVRIYAYDPYVDPEKARRLNVELVDLETLLRESDVVTVHVPPSPETVNLVGEREIGMMKESAVLLNLANPVVVDEDALYRALESGRIAGAALDVFTEEPVDSSNRFLKFDNVIVTPHIGGNTVETVERQSRMVVEDLLKIARGEKPARLLNPEVWEKWLEKYT